MNYFINADISSDLHLASGWENKLYGDSVLNTKGKTTNSLVEHTWSYIMTLRQQKNFKNKIQKQNHTKENAWIFTSKLKISFEWSTPSAESADG